MTVRILPSRLAGVAQAPPSKSMAQRLLACAALAGGTSRLRGVRPSGDVCAALRAAAALGAGVEWDEETAVVRGAPSPVAWRGAVGAGAVPAPAAAAGPAEAAAQRDSAVADAPVVDCGESAATLRLFLPLLALGARPVRFTGGGRLLRRPMGEYAALFRGMGLGFQQESGGITATGPLAPGVFPLRGDSSSQFVSGLLLALPLLPGDSTIQLAAPPVSAGYIELTREVQARFGVCSHWDGPQRLLVPGCQRYKAGCFDVEGDWSQGAVLAVLGALRGGVRVAGLDAASLQPDRAVLEILRRCGAAVGWRDGLLCAAPGAGPLQSPGGVDISGCPDLGPLLCALALFCPGTTHITGAARLRHKESDRLAAVLLELEKLGGHLRAEGDRIIVEGGHPLKNGCRLDSHGDHRMVMALAVAALAAGVEAEITGAQAVEKSWPGFFDVLAGLGARLGRA